MNDPDLNLLFALDVLLAEKSVAAAARRLNLSASAMSRTLSRLRETTGDPLLVRAGRQMVLTPYADSLRERTQGAVFAARAVLRPAPQEFDITRHQQTFTLRANDGFVEAFGPALIAAAARCAPGIRLRFAPKPVKSDRPLREGEADLEIGVPGEMGPEIKQQRLFSDRFVGVVRSDHPLAGRNVTPEDYTAWNHVAASRRGVLTGPVDDALAQLGLSRNIAAVVPGFPAALAVARGDRSGGARWPASFLINLPGDTGLTWFELPVATRPITVSQMWHPRLDADPAHRWLRQFVLAECRARMPEG